MFLSSKKKEQELIRELELTRQTEKVAFYTREIRNVLECNYEGNDLFVELEERKNNFDKVLTQVVKNIQDIRQGEEERFSREQMLFDIIKGMAEGLTETETMYEQLLTCVKSNQENLAELTNKSQAVEEVTPETENGITDETIDVAQVKEQLKEMKEFGRQMGVLSLNAAIEAGRMGESGRKFVTTSQEVCEFADKYQEATESLSAQIEELQKQIEEKEVLLEKRQKEVEQLTEILKENHMSVAKAAQGLLDCLGPIEEKPAPAWASVSRNLVEGFQMATASTGEHEKYFEEAMQYMEQAGEIYINEQHAMEKLKIQWKHMQTELEKCIQE